MSNRMLERADAELVEAARGGEVNAFGELYRRHHAAAVGIAYAALGDVHLAEDAAQEAFAVACRDLGMLRDADRFAAWLGAICRNVARRAAKARLRRGVAEHKAMSTPRDDSAEDNVAVRASVQRLPRSAREVVLLHYFSGLSYERIAASLNISPQAVHGRLIRARRKLADDLRRNDLGRSTS